MRLQRKMSQIKEEDKTPEQLSEVETKNILKKKFRKMIVKMIQGLKKRMEQV